VSSLGLPATSVEEIGLKINTFVTFIVAVDPKTGYTTMKKNHKGNAFAIDEKVMVLSPTSKWKGKIGTIEKHFESSGWYSVKIQEGTSVRFKGKNLGKADPSYLQQMQEQQDREQHANPEPEQTTSNTNVPCVETVPDEEEDSLFVTDSMVTDDQRDIASAIPEQHTHARKESEHCNDETENIEHLSLEEQVRILKRELRRMNALVNSMVQVSRCNVNLDT
jgi:hypothetical protein